MRSAQCKQYTFEDGVLVCAKAYGAAVGYGQLSMV